MNTRSTLALVPVMLLAGSLAAWAHPASAAENLADAFGEGDWGVSFLWRLELVDQDPFSNDALAAPLRTRLNYGTGDLKGFTLFVEFDYISDLGLDNYDEGAGNTPGRDIWPMTSSRPGPGSLSTPWKKNGAVFCAKNVMTNRRSAMEKSRSWASCIMASRMSSR